MMTMNTKSIFKIIFTMVLAFNVVGCGYDEELVEELSIDREFSPVGLKANVRNQVNVELNWDLDEDVQNYIVEVSTDPGFATIEETIAVSNGEIPVLIPLLGETQYYFRVKAISSRGLNDSKWSTVEALTLTEQLFINNEDGDIKATQATLRWLPNNMVTSISLSPGDIVYTISPEERAAGVATITGLTAETDYTAQLLNGNVIRGISMFTTGIDIGDNTLVLPTDDLFQMIADAAPGDILLLEQGDYTAQVGTITLDKSITIQGLRVDFKPQLKVSFSIVEGATDVNLIDLDLTGDVASELTDMVRYSAAGNYNSLLISGCNIHDYDRSFVAGSESGAVVQTVTVENSIISNVMTNGGDFFDFRDSDVLNVNFKTSTFYNCAPGRDFIRLDASGISNDTGLTVDIVIDQCTIYACANSDSRRLLYVRFVSNEVTVTNTIIAETASEGYADRSGIDESPTFNNNNYFNAPGYYDTAQYIFDDGNYTTLDPGFADPSTGDFTVTNQAVLDQNVGDPRWLQ